MNSTNKVAALALALTTCLALLPETAAGIPAFARRYKLSCTTCHAPFPRLKAYGDEFAAAGFVIREQDKDRDYVTAGDPLLWLNRTFQLGIRFDAWLSAQDDPTAPESVDSDLETPWGLKLLSGGALTRSVSYYFYFYMNERGEVAGIEDAYLHFDDIGGKPLDLLVGQFQTSDPLMKRELRLSYEDYEIYKTKVGLSQTSLTYDRGLMAMYGVEPTGTDLVAFVVNGNGKPEAGDNRRYDGDRFKNVGVRLAQGLGDLARVGGYYYLGKEALSEPDGDGATVHNELSYVGADGSLALGPLTLTGQYLLRRDSNPEALATAPDADVETQGIVGELVYLPQGEDGRHAIVLLYNRVDSDLDAADYESISVGTSYLLARNLRVHAEYTRDVEHERSRGVLGVVSGF